MFRGIVDVGAALEETGGVHFSQYIRPVISVTGRRWQDFSQGSGIPRYNAYVGSPLVYTQLNGFANEGIYSGEDAVAGEEKRLYQIRMSTPSLSAPCTFILCDYLGFYPLIDFSEAGLQEMDNTAISTRYSSNHGVMMMLVNTVPTTISSTVTVNYVDSDDVSRSVTFNTITASVSQMQNGTTGTNIDQTTPFISLAAGSKGVKSVTSVLSNGLGDGFAHIVLVRALGAVNTAEQNTITEVSFINDKMTLPKIENGAYLNFIGMLSLSSALNMRGELTIIRVPK